MDDLIKELVLGAPSIGAIVFIVWIFIRHLERRDKLLGENMDKNTNMLAKIEGVLLKINGKDSS